MQIKHTELSDIFFHNKYQKTFQYLLHEAACIEIISNKTENCGEKHLKHLCE